MNEFKKFQNKKHKKSVDILDVWKCICEVKIVRIYSGGYLNRNSIYPKLLFNKLNEKPRFIEYKLN